MLVAWISDAERALPGGHVGAPGMAPPSKPPPAPPSDVGAFPLHPASVATREKRMVREEAILPKILEGPQMSSWPRGPAKLSKVWPEIDGVAQPGERASPPTPRAEAVTKLARAVLRGERGYAKEDFMRAWYVLSPLLIVFPAAASAEPQGQHFVDLEVIEGGQQASAQRAAGFRLPIDAGAPFEA
jgi:hypothetical protein